LSDTAEERLRFLAEHMREALFTQDAALNITYASPSATRMFGYAAEEILGLSLADIMTPESLARAHQVYGRHLEQAGDGDLELPLLQFQYRRKDGSLFWGEFRPTFLRDADGRVTGSHGVLRDITERKRAEEERHALLEQLRRSEQLQVIGQLASGIAHDFNNQLTGILGFAETIAGTCGDERIGALADSIVQAAEKASGITRRLLDLSRKGGPESAAVDVHAVVAEVATMLEHGVDRSVRVVRRLCADAAFVWGDATALASALLNLGLNARDALPGGGELVFATACRALPSRVRVGDGSVGPGEFLELRVRDDGEGIAPEHLDRLFEPFFTTKPPGKGTGLGLVAVRGTVEDHGGAIEVASAPGLGTEFTILLPLCGRDAVAAGGPQGGAEEPPRGGR
jgi:PAS domain S-box-containing protein